jgi:hypothetical protein
VKAAGAHVSLHGNSGIGGIGGGGLHWHILDQEHKIEQVLQGVNDVQLPTTCFKTPLII